MSSGGKNKNLLELALTLMDRLKLHCKEVVPLGELAEYSTEKIGVEDLDLSSYLFENPQVQ